MGSRSLRTRVAGHAAMQLVVQAQSVAPPRAAWQRVFGLAPLSPEASRWFDVALGDAVVGDQLQQLGPRWDVLHDVPGAGGRTIDHVVIGPGGAFVLRAVHCGGGEVLIDGDDLSVAGSPRVDLAEVTAAASTADAALETTVRALLVLVASGRITERAVPSRARVIPTEQLRQILVRGRPRLSGLEVAALSDRADQTERWPTRADHADHRPDQSDECGAQSSTALHTPEHDADLRREFDGIRATVTSALRRRTAWAIAIFATGAGMMLASIAAFTTFVLLN